MTLSVVNYDENKELDDINEIKLKILQLFDEIHYEVPSNKKIFLKPNLCGRDPKLKSENTSGSFLEAVIQIYVSKNNQVLVGHTSLLGTIEIDYPFERLVQAQNYPEVVDKYPNAKLVNLDNLPQKVIERDEIKFEIPKILDELDEYISLTKLKTHSQTTVSLSMKNQMGTVCMENRKDMHYLGVHHYIAEMATFLKPDLNIIDGILAMEGQGPHHGDDIRFNLILGGTDMVELDSLACFLMGIDHRQVGYIKEGYEKGIGKYVSQEIKNKYSHLKRNFKLALPMNNKIKNIWVWPTTSCTGCSAAMVEVGLKFDKAPQTSQFQLPRMDLFLGTGEGLDLEKMGKTIGIGDCAKDFCKAHQIDHLPGCPMSIKKMQDYVFKKLIKHVTEQTTLMFKDLKMILEGRIMTDEVISKSYDRVSQVYESLWGKYTKVFNKELIERLQISEGMDVLDLACGTGSNTIEIAKLSKTGKVIGIDLSPGMLEQAKAHAYSLNISNVEFIEGDMLNSIIEPNFENTKFDRIITFWALGYSDPVKILRELKRLLKKNGKIGIITNMGDSPRNVYNTYLELAAQYTDSLAVRVNHHFPTNESQFRQFFIDSSYNLNQIEFGYGKFEKHVPDGQAVLDWMLKTGAGTLYDDSIKPEWKEKMHNLFKKRMNRYKNGNGITITHEFYTALVT